MDILVYIRNNKASKLAHVLYTAFLCLLVSGSALAGSAGMQKKAALQPEEAILHLHCDRDLYIAGEHLYFQVYHMEGIAKKSAGRIVYLVLQNQHNQLIKKIILRLNNNSFHGHIYLPDTLSTGSYQLITYTNQMRRHDHAHQKHRKDIFIANRFDEKLESLPTEAPDSLFGPSPNPHRQIQTPKRGSPILKTDKNIYGRREKVVLKISPSTDQDSLLKLSATVAHHLSFLEQDGHSQPTASSLQVAETDNRQPIQTDFYHEYENPILEGRVIDRNNEAGIENVRVILSTPDSLLNFNYAKTGPGGNFRLSIHDFYLDKPLYLSLDTSALEAAARLLIFDKFDIRSNARPATFRFLPQHKVYIQNSQEYVKIAKAFEIDHTRQTADASKASGFRPLLYSTPKHSVKPALFMPLNDFSEISRELLSPLRLRKQASRLHARMQIERTAYQFFDRPPAVFLDAIPVADINDIAHLASEDIERIEMQNFHWAYGKMRFEGILAVFSTNEAFRQLKLPDYTNLVEAYTLLRPAFYQTPEYSLSHDQLNRTPDLRQLLHWQANIQLENTETVSTSFYTGDLKGLYLIKAEGITIDGKRVTAVSSFIVE